jgi:hypothetical protein
VLANEVGRACGTYGRGEKSVQGFGGGKRPLGRPGVDERMGSEWILGRLGGGTGFDWLRIGTGG